MQRKKIQSEQSAHSGELTEQQQTNIINETRRLLKNLTSGGDKKYDMKAKILSLRGGAVPASMIFFNTVSRELSGEDYNAQEREAIAHRLSNICESFLRLLGPAEALIATSSLLRIKEFQQWLGYKMVDEVAMKIEKADKTIGIDIAMAIKNLSLSRQLDTIHQFATISSQVAMRGISRALDSRPINEIMGGARQKTTVGKCADATKALEISDERMTCIIKAIRKHASLPLTRYACDEARAAINERHAFFLNSETKDEIYNRGVSRGDPTEGRQMERTDENWYIEDMRLREQIDVPAQPRRLPVEDKQLLHRVASDAVALYDHTLVPQSIARVDFSRLPISRGPSFALASTLIQDREILESAFSYSLSRTLLHYFPLYIIDQSPEQLAQVFGFASTALNKKEWIHYFSLWKDLLSESDSPDMDKERITMEIILIEKRLESKKESVIREMFESAQRTIDTSNTKPISVRFQSFSQTSLDPELNPFVGSDQEHIPLLLQHLHRPGLRKMIENDLGISFTEISITSQIHLLRFFATARKEQLERFSRCIQLTGESRADFLQSFMAVAENPSAAQIIFDVVEKTQGDPTQRKRIFSALKTITDAASSVGEYMRSQYKKAGDQDSIRKTVQRLLRKGKGILDEIVKETGGDVVDSLKNISSEILLLTSTFKMLRESGRHVPLSEIESVDVNIFKGDELRGFVKKAGNWNDMESLYRSRYTDPKYSEEFRNKLIKGFRTAVESEHTSLYVIKHRVDIIAFCRFEKQSDGSLYFGSFVVDARYDNHKLGMALLEESLLKLGRTHRIEAECDPTSPAAALYARLGFYVTKHYNLEGVAVTHIVRDPKGFTFQEQIPA